MTQLLTRTIVLFMLLMTPLMSWAGSLEEAIQAFDRQDYQQAYEQLLPLAKQGNGEAQYYIGGMLFDGLGIPANPTKGVYWLEQAIANEYYLAARELGNRYLSGFGVPMDTKKGADYIILYDTKSPEDEVEPPCD